MDIGTELKSQNYDRNTQGYFLTPNIDSKDEFPFTYHTSNTHQSTCEKEPESEPHFAYNQKKNGSLINSQAFHLYSNESSRSQLYSGVFFSNRESNAGIEDQKKGIDQFNKFLDFSQQDLYDNQEKRSRNNTLIKNNELRRNSPSIQIINDSPTNQNSVSNQNQNVPIQTLEYELQNIGGNGNNQKNTKFNQERFDMMMIIDVDEDEQMDGYNPFDKDIENDGNLFNAPVILQQQVPIQGNFVNQNKQSSYTSTSYNKHHSLIEQSTRPLNEFNRIKSQSMSKGVQNINYEIEEIESYDKPIDEKINNNTQKSYLHKKRIKENLIELQAVNDQKAQYAHDKSNSDSWNTKNSLTEQRKFVSNYLFNEREPMYSTKYSKCYIASKNQNLVLVKMIERKKVQQFTQEKMRIQFRQIVKKINEKQQQLQEYRGSSYGQKRPSIMEQDYSTRSIANVLDYFQTKAYIYIIYEYLHKQSLVSIIQQSPKQKLEDKKALIIIEQIINSIEELQSLNNNMFQQHGNLKLENLFWDGINIKLSDFCPTYLLAKQDIDAFDKRKLQPQNSDAKSLGIIYLQLLCGVHAINHITDEDNLQNFLTNENQPRHIVNMLVSSIFSETASLSDFRKYINKNQMRLKKSPVQSSFISSHRSSIQNTTAAAKSTFQKSPPNRQATSNFLSILRGGDEKPGIIGSFLQERDLNLNGNHSSEAYKGKIKETLFLKKYGYTQSHSSFELKLNHLKVTKYKLGDDCIFNEQEFETSYSIPIYKNTSEEVNLRKRKNLTQLNYSPKYNWQFIKELDNLPYYEREQKAFEEMNSNQYLLDGYYKLFNSKYQLMKCRDKKSKKNYILKCITIEDDQEFNEILREIAISKYIEHNIQPGIKVEKLNEEYDKDNYHTKMDIIQSMENINQISSETQKMAMSYLENLYREADKEVVKQFQGGIQKFVDSYIVQRVGNEFTFFLIYEEVQFSLKDYILKNAVDLEDNSEKEEINQLQLFNMVYVITKQIKALKRIGIVHNNITPENILFQNCQSGKKRIILSNFQNALIMRHDQSQDEFSATFFKLPNECYKYKAPEIRKMMEVSMQEKEQVSFDPIKSEIFSLGLCAIELKFNQILKDSQIVAIIETIQTQTIDGDLILYMIHFSSSIRFSEKEVLQYLTEETQIEKTLQSINSSPLILSSTNHKTSNNLQPKPHVQRTNVKSFTQILSVQNLHRIQEPQASKFQRTANKKLTMNSLARIPSLKSFQGEQPELKPASGKLGTISINKNDLFQYIEMSLTNFGDIAEGLQLLFQCKCSRILYLFNNVQQILEQLDLKFFKSKQKFPDQSKLEYLILQEMAQFRRDVYDYVGSADLSKRILGIQSKYFPDDLYSAGKFQLNIAVLDQEKNNSQLIYYLRSALDNFKEILGNSSPKLVKILTLLGDEYAQKGQVMDALHQYQECMIITNYLGYQGPFGIRLLDKLGWAFFQTSDYQSSLKFFQKSAQIKERVLIEKDSSLAETFNNLAECYRVLNDQNKAMYYYEQSLSVIQNFISISEKNQGQPFAGQQGQFLLQLKSQVYNNLGIMYKQFDKFEKAIKLFNESYQIKCQLYGPNSIEVQESLYNVAVIYDDQNQHTQAMQIYDQIIQQFKITKDLDNLVYADCLHNKGICYYNMNDFSKALTLLNEALSIKKKKMNNSVSQGVTIQNLALVYHKIGQYKKSLQLYEEGLKIFTKKLKPDHPYIFIIQENMKQTQRFAK